MFEFHGWANLRCHTHDTNEMLQYRKIEEFKQYISENHLEDIYMIKRRNGLDSFVITGMHNHCGNYIIDIFQWIADNLPGSYGLLYIHDDEDIRDGADNRNKFIVWKLARGVLSREEDKYLSPYIPTVEDEYDSSWED